MQATDTSLVTKPYWDQYIFPQGSNSILLKTAKTTTLLVEKKWNFLWELISETSSTNCTHKSIPENVTLGFTPHKQHPSPCLTNALPRVSTGRATSTMSDRADPHKSSGAHWHKMTNKHTVTIWFELRQVLSINLSYFDPHLHKNLHPMLKTWNSFPQTYNKSKSEHNSSFIEKKNAFWTSIHLVGTFQLLPY